MLQRRYQALSFDGFTIDLLRACLFGRGGEEVKLRPKSFEVLKYLAENSGRLIGKEELFGSVWPNTAVTDDSLVQCLIEVRRALGEDGQRIVKTVPRRGYIFQANVTERELDDHEAVSTGEAELSPGRHEEEAPSNEKTASATSDAVPLSRQRRPSRAMTTALACAGLVLVAMTVISYRHRIAPSQDGPGLISSIAVLPLENLSGDPAQEYFADGMTELLINNLAQIRALKVISRTSVMSYRGSNKRLPDIARELNVDAVIEGSVQRSGGRVRITAQLIPATTDSPLWAREYDRDLTDVLRLQGEIARAVVDEIRVQVTPEQRARLALIRPVNPQAYEAFLLGRYHAKKLNEESLKHAVEYFERAIQLAPDYAAAYAGLSDAWLQRGMVKQNWNEIESLARAAALKAVALDDQLAEAHLALANINYMVDWDWAGAEREARRALELDPGNSAAYVRLGRVLMFLGRDDEAIREAQIAAQLDPLSSDAHAALGWFFHFTRRLEDALPHLQRAVELEPRSMLANYYLGIVFAQSGKYDEAIAAFEQVGELTPGGSLRDPGIAYVHALMGKPGDARRMISRVKANDYGPALVYATLGDKDEAFRILQNAVEERVGVIAIKSEPAFQNLHSDPRWKKLLRLMNYPGG